MTWEQLQALQTQYRWAGDVRTFRKGSPEGIVLWSDAEAMDLLPDGTCQPDCFRWRVFRGDEKPFQWRLPPRLLTPPRLRTAYERVQKHVRRVEARAQLAFTRLLDAVGEDVAVRFAPGRVISIQRQSGGGPYLSCYERSEKDETTFLQNLGNAPVVALGREAQAMDRMQYRSWIRLALFRNLFHWSVGQHLPRNSSLALVEIEGRTTVWTATERSTRDYRDYRDPPWEEVGEVEALPHVRFESDGSCTAVVAAGVSTGEGR